MKTLTPKKMVLLVLGMLGIGGLVVAATGEAAQGLGLAGTVAAGLIGYLRGDQEDDGTPGGG